MTTPTDKMREDALHAAVCQAVALMNVSPEVARSKEGREAHNILREALIAYADATLPAPAPAAQAPCATYETSSGDYTVCRTCGETWPTGYEPACKRAKALLAKIAPAAQGAAQQAPAVPPPSDPPMTERQMEHYMAWKQFVEDDPW